MAKEIPLSKGYVAIVDDEDYTALSKHKWCVHVMSHTCYAMRRERVTKRTILMHRQLLDFPVGEVDHINHNGLDNRRCNIRAVTRSENNMNRRKKSGATSRYRGVCWDRFRKKWCAHVTIGGQLKKLGRFSTEEEAARAYDAEAFAARGNRAILNFPVSA